jgi:hemolysin-activating ACP:hemolysin acyltransferase
VTLTPKLAISVTVAGLSVRDAASGEQLWLSPGFAPRGCANPSVANGRVFWPSAANGMIFCWEPEK